MTAERDGLSAVIDDATLIAQSRRRPDRFAALYDRHFREIYAYISGRLGGQIADDLAAEVFLVAFRKRDTFDPARGAVLPWLYGIATNLVAQHRRSEMRRLDALLRTPPDTTAEHGHEDVVATRVTAASTQGRLAAAIGDLPDRDRDVLVLVALGELTYEEVAQALDIPFGTVGSRLNRVRRKLRARLGDVNPMLGETHG
ncbi:RNA polymerase sigma factor [Microtetraspora malaysiensis]|uniref:RNA polymerase sigma factor n=1 Tax=Microtetraspora malaysiensis TaxID=161358 RepID=UPI003D8DA04F